MAGTSVIVLLRGVNVGGKNRLPMAELRAAATSAGYDDAATYLQSGNLVVRDVARSKVNRVAGELHSAIEEESGLDVPVIVRTIDEWRAIIAANPFPEAAGDGTKLHLVVLPAAATNALQEFDASPFAPEALHVGERELYLSLPDGMGPSKLAVGVMRVDNARLGTARNWKTVLALARTGGAIADGSRNRGQALAHSPPMVHSELYGSVFECAARCLVCGVVGLHATRCARAARP